MVTLAYRTNRSSEMQSEWRLRSWLPFAAAGLIVSEHEAQLVVHRRGPARRA
jgi:hypothetical protein